MPRFEPFRGLRYARGADLSELACPPYDVIDADERARLSDMEARNAVHIELPIGHDPYRGAADTLTDWTTEGVLVRDAEPTLYAYRMTPPESSPTIGYIGALGVTDADGLLPHEQTTPKARSDRLDLLRATRVNTSPIWALSLASGLAALWGPSEDPIASATDAEGVLHEMWGVPREPAARVAAAVGAAPVVVADGHHRWETARNYLRERPGDAGAELVLALVVELSAEELEVRAIHRLVNSVPRGMRFPEALEPWFEVVAPTDAELTLLAGPDEVGLRALPATRDGAAHDADAERVQVALDSLAVNDVSYAHDAGVVRAEVAAGRASAGLLLRAVTVDVIAAAAHAGERFPPKTTFFWPKPLTGFVFRPLDP